jgi:hypothetical protein
MGWERRGGRQYYFRSVRVDGRPRKLYLGAGAAAEDCARRLAQKRRELEEGRAALRAEREKAGAAEAALAEACGLARLLLAAGLLLAGLREHRGCWRRRRGQATRRQKADREAGKRTEGGGAAARSAGGIGPCGAGPGG